MVGNSIQMHGNSTMSYLIENVPIRNKGSNNVATTLLQLPKITCDNLHLLVEYFHF